MSRRGTPPEVFVLVILAVVLIGVWYFNKDNRLKRAIRAARRFAIRDLPDDTLGRIVGAANPLDRVLASPITGRPCVYYITTVSTTGKNSRVVIREERSVPFCVVDGTGRALIDPAGAEIALVSDGQTSSGTLNDPTPAEQAFLARHGESSSNVFGSNRGLRYEERTIGVGEQIAIVGAAVREPDPDAVRPESGYREAPVMRLRMTSSAYLRLQISDDATTMST